MHDGNDDGGMGQQMAGNNTINHNIMYYRLSKIIVTSRYILNDIASLTLDCAVLKQTLNKKHLRKISTVSINLKNYYTHC